MSVWRRIGLRVCMCSSERVRKRERERERKWEKKWEKRAKTNRRKTYRHRGFSNTIGKCNTTRKSQWCIEYGWSMICFWWHITFFSLWILWVCVGKLLRSIRKYVFFLSLSKISLSLSLSYVLNLWLNQSHTSIENLWFVMKNWKSLYSLSLSLRFDT